MLPQNNNSSTTWVESGVTGQYLAVRHYESDLNVEDEADQKALGDIDWSKIGFYKRDLTQLNGAQGSEVLEKTLKGGDIAYHKGTKQYLKLDKFILGKKEEESGAGAA